MVGRIYDRLVQRFGKDAIFKDVDSLPLGRDFRRHIDSVVSECCVALVVVGDRWIAASGASRLDDPRDYVRIEIESALKRDIPVIPLLVHNAELPADESLPESLKDFAYRNGMSIGHDPHFHADMDRLIKHLEELMEGRREQEETQLATAPAPIPAPEQVVSAERPGPSDSYQHPIHVLPEQERPRVAPVVGGSAQTSALASQHVETHADLWIAAKDRGRIVLLYLCFSALVGILLGLANNIRPVPPSFRDSIFDGHLTYDSFRGFLAVVSPLISLILAGGQALILKRHIGSARRWIGYTAVAAVIDSLVRTQSSAAPLQSLFALAILNNFTRSGLQWLVLRTLVKRAWLWIVVGSAAGAAYRAIQPGSGAQNVLATALLSSLIGGAEILCLIKFRRK